MANHPSKDLTFKIDNAAGSLTAITGFLNQASIASVMSLLEDTAIGDDEREFIPDVASATIPINGFVNTTTDGIFGPLVGNRTSVTKTVEYYNGESYYTGEVLPTDVQFSGGVGNLITFSANFTFDGAVTRTSVAA